MKKNVIFLLLTLTTFNLYAKSPGGEQVDPFIEAKFKKEFGSSVNVSWKIVEDVSVAIFIDQGGQEKEVFYDTDGEILGLGKDLKRDLLPENVNRSIKTRFNSGIIQTAYEFKSKSSSTRYYVIVITERYAMIVSADEFGGMTIVQKDKLKRPRL
jgi:hypothetical protein